jgi:hypothetical protein
MDGGIMRVELADAPWISEGEVPLVFDVSPAS